MELFIIILIGALGVGSIYLNPFPTNTIALGMPSVLAPTVTDSQVIGVLLIIGAILLFAVFLVVAAFRPTFDQRVDSALDKIGRQHQ